jgi:hypothetical protein
MYVKNSEICLSYLVYVICEVSSVEAVLYNDSEHIAGFVLGYLTSVYPYHKG